ncbi:DMT family transporter [Marinobacter shengliensis]|uniref:DMT family transporter n=1 Tax=Marinobacter shengliensis TaxID=1389223 RepID=UPI002572E20E|nr:DMT family transporter [Marinobacter shengliensis]
MSIRSIVGMLLVTVLWAICFPFIVVGLPDAPPLLFAALRALLAGICLVLIALARGGRVRYSPRRFFLLTAIGFSYTGMGLGGMFLGAGELGPGLATVLANAQPLFAAVLSYFFIREVVSGRLFAGLLIGFIGVVVLAAPDMEVSNSRFIGSVYILGGAVGTAIGNVLLKYQAGSDDIYWSMGIQLVIGSVFLGFASVILGEGMDINWTWSFATAALVLSIPATALMVVLWYALLASAPLNSLNSFTFLTPALGVVIGQLWFGETFSVVEIIGISITIFGLIIVMKAPGEGGRVREVRPGID